MFAVIDMLGATEKLVGQYPHGTERPSLAVLAVDVFARVLLPRFPKTYLLSQTVHPHRTAP